MLIVAPGGTLETDTIAVFCPAMVAQPIRHSEAAAANTAMSLFIAISLLWLWIVNLLLRQLVGLDDGLVRYRREGLGGVVETRSLYGYGRAAGKRRQPCEQGQR